MSELIVAAVITGCFGVLVAVIQRGHKRNSREHMENAGRLDSILVATGRIEEKIDEHLANHKDGTA